ncbi:MAG TPA: dTDP-4-dehydrorhamnose 3,5-epimerase [Rhodanobacteraceae bacterium]|nr:dTDP-4-dehydrorhamnose 3,5-epimerase [Rhodanobacteraceae bacterium]
MKRIDTDLPGVCVLEPRVFGDERGFFYESYNAARFAELGIDANFVQSNVSRSMQGVLRGLHYQWPNPQGKLVSVLDGEVYDVAVDIRHGSPTFGRWSAAVLSADNKRHFWVPEGFAHGFCVLSESATFTYQCTALYDPSADAGIRWNDGDIGVDWPISQPQLSAKDEKAPFLADIAPERLPVFIP